MNATTAQLVLRLMIYLPVLFKEGKRKHLWRFIEETD